MSACFDTTIEREGEEIAVTDAGGTEYELTEAEADKFRTQCFDDEGDRYAAAMERHAEDLDARLFEASGRENVENHKESNQISDQQ